MFPELIKWNKSQPLILLNVDYEWWIGVITTYVPVSDMPCVQGLQIYCNIKRICTRPTHWLRFLMYSLKNKKMWYDC